MSEDARKAVFVAAVLVLSGLLVWARTWSLAGFLVAVVVYLLAIQVLVAWALRE